MGTGEAQTLLVKVRRGTTTCEDGLVVSEEVEHNTYRKFQKQHPRLFVTRNGNVLRARTRPRQCR